MKKIMITAFGFSFIGALAQADDYKWHSVLSCDNGAVVVDNASNYESNRLINHELITTAQVVIHDGKIVEYFSNAGVGTIIHNSQNGRTGWDYTVAQTVNGQWIATGGFEKGDAPLRSFLSPYQMDDTLGKIAYYFVAVQYDGSGLKVVAEKDPQHQANWYFRNCIER